MMKLLRAMNSVSSPSFGTADVCLENVVSSCRMKAKYNVILILCSYHASLFVWLAD